MPIISSSGVRGTLRAHTAISGARDAGANVNLADGSELGETENVEAD